jgi:hypothetical protein
MRQRKARTSESSKPRLTRQERLLKMGKFTFQVTLHDNVHLCGQWLRIWTGAHTDPFRVEECLDLFRLNVSFVHHSVHRGAMLLTEFCFCTYADICLMRRRALLLPLPPPPLPPPPQQPPPEAAAAAAARLLLSPAPAAADSEDTVAAAADA